MERRSVRISRVGLNPLALFEGLLAAVIGLAVSIVAWFGAVWNYTAATDSLLRGLLFGLVPGLGAVIIVTIVYFLAGALVGYVHGFLYNLVAGMMGGVEVATRREVDEAPMPSASSGTARGRRPEPTFGETIDTKRRIDR